MSLPQARVGVIGGSGLYHIEGLDDGQIDESGAGLPSMQIILFMIRATQDLITTAGTLPNLPGPSNDGENGSGSTAT